MFIELNSVPVGLGSGAYAHLGIFLRIHHGCDGDAEVGDWAPEILCKDMGQQCRSVRFLVQGRGWVRGSFDVRVEQT